MVLGSPGEEPPRLGADTPGVLRNGEVLVSGKSPEDEVQRA